MYYLKKEHQRALKFALSYDSKTKTAPRHFTKMINALKNARESVSSLIDINNDNLSMAIDEECKADKKLVMKEIKYYAEQIKKDYLSFILLSEIIEALEIDLDLELNQK
tara:strand:+ start:96 stop:422 length:327 start_codon:yes stop_codon:yes gene_type:complete